MGASGLIVAGAILFVWYTSSSTTYPADARFDLQRAMNGWTNYDMIWLYGTLPVVTAAFAIGGFASSLLLFLPVAKGFLKWVRPIMGAAVSIWCISFLSYSTSYFHFRKARSLFWDAYSTDE